MNLQKQLVRAQRQRAIAARKKTPRERLALAKKQRAREKAAQERTLTAAGLSPHFAAKLQVAASQAEHDPEARALFERAKLAKRIEVAKRENGIGKPSPDRFMGATVREYEAAVDTPTKIPPRLSDLRKTADEPKKGRKR